ncbi:ATP-binding protein [Sporosarcina sp. GW1-11]|uniref:two-component system sensor histidine kinase NtrB n=1 Tax=Sporosarcina sp. GW1-11 TaxID=2899126 RepID=UPI00294B9A82|nr:ATP-binding protein [Sporosarcina sp. GW1-11]MDV6376881.1 ATP-binding protein [Sporosarcina sp. GW1-11]
MSTQLKNTPTFYNYLEQLFKQSQDAISVCNIDDTMICCNPAFEKLYGWTMDECIGKVIDFYPETEIKKGKARRDQMKEGKTFKNVRVIERRKDGSTFHAEIDMLPIFNEYDEVIAISYSTHDITSRLLLEQKRAELFRLKNLSTIASFLAHEVRNPMTAITGFIQMMNKDAENPYRNFTTIMENEVDNVNQLITDFLELATPSLHNQTMVSTLEVIQEAMSDYDATFSNRAITCRLHTPTHDTLILGNIYSLKQVFSNIISNSCDAIGQDGQIDITVKLLDQFICITIVDNGSGMSPSTLESIDQPFFTTKDGARGLGILISKKIILDHYGSLDIESIEHAGTKVTICLPLSNESLH